jgi:hypothetical protein
LSNQVIIFLNSLNKAFRHNELEASDIVLVLWEPTQGKASRGKLTFVDMLRRDLGLESAGELRALMKDKCRWHTRPKLQFGMLYSTCWQTIKIYIFRAKLY